MGLLDGIQLDEGGMHKRGVEPYGLDLELDGVKKQIDLLIEKKNELSEAKIISSDPNQQFSLKQQLLNLEEEIKAKREEIVHLANRTKSGPKGEKESKKGSFDMLLSKVDKLRDDTNQIKQKLKEGFEQVERSFETLFGKLSDQDKMVLAILNLSQEHKTDLAELFLKVDAHAFSEEKLEEFNQEITETLENNLDKLPDQVVQKWKEANAKASGIPDAKSKVKLKIPIIPAILEVEKELDWNLKKLVRSIWNDLKSGHIFRNNPLA